MSRPRRDGTEPPTPLSNWARIVAMEAEMERMNEVIQQLQRALDVQFQRTGQLQAELDVIRAAWTKATPKVKRGT